MDFLFDKADVARAIFETRMDVALEGHEFPDIDSTDVRESIRREARLASEAAKILFEEMEAAGIEPAFTFEQGFPEVLPMPEPRLDANEISNQWLRELGIDPTPRNPEE